MQKNITIHVTLKRKRQTIRQIFGTNIKTWTKNNRQLLLNVRFSLLRLGQQFSRAVNVPLVRPSVSQTGSQSQSINQSIIHLIPGLQVWFGKRKVRFGLGILLD